MTRPRKYWYMTQFGGVAHTEHPNKVWTSDCGKTLVRKAGKYDQTIKCEKCASVRRVRASLARRKAK